MSGILQERVADARAIERTLVQGDARLCSPIFGRVCKVIWPIKTAEGLAAAAGYKSIRAAAYEISGERPPSDKSMLAVINEIFQRK